VGETEKLEYYFLVGNDRKSTDGFFSIDAVTGRISLSEEGALNAGVAKYDLACKSYDVQVVAFDGMVNSNVEKIRIERTLPDVQPGPTADAAYSLSAMLETGEDFLYDPGQVRVSVDHHHHSVLTIDDTSYFDTYKDQEGVEHRHSFDILDLDILGDVKAFSVEKDHNSDNLRIKLDATTYSLVGGPIEGLTLEADGSWSFDPTSVKAYQSLKIGEDEEIKVSYETTDKFGVTRTGEFNIKLTGTSEGPVASSEASKPEDSDDAIVNGQLCEQYVSIVVNGHYAAPGEGNGSMEYIHFDAQSSFAGYTLSGDPEPDLTLCEQDQLDEVSFFPEYGSYRIANQAATSHGEKLEGTACNDLIAGSSAFKERLSGGNGNDLLFASGHCDTLEGGAGNDLLVLDGEHGRIEFLAAAVNGSDTVVNFDKKHNIRLSIDGLSKDAPIQEEDHFCNEIFLQESEVNPSVLVFMQKSEEAPYGLVFSEDAASAAVVAMDTGSRNLHTWITNFEEQPTIQGIQVESGTSQYFLVEDVHGNTQLYFASDKTGDGATNVGLLTADEFVHMAQFTGAGIGEFSLHNVLFPVI